MMASTLTTISTRPTVLRGRAGYAIGAYYWKVEARTINGAVIATSGIWSFTRKYKLYLPSLRREV